MSADRQKRHELQQFWKSRTERAKARLDRAAESIGELTEKYEAVPAGGASAHNVAIRLYTEALEDYTKTSRTYQELVLHGTIPDEKEAAPVPSRQFSIRTGE